MIDSPQWHENAECAKPENSNHADKFFANKPSQQFQALKMCEACPVRQQCAKWALEEKQVWGIWGGMTPRRIRRTLSVNWEGQEMRHKRFPLCPGCDAKTDNLTTQTVTRPNGGRWSTMRIVECTNCKFSWQSRTSANAVTAFHASKAAKAKSTGKNKG